MKMGIIGYAIAGVAIVVVMLFVVIPIVAPDVAAKIPIVKDSFQTVYYADVEYDFTSPGWVWESTTVNIVNVTLEKKMIPLSIGPLFIWPETWEGKVVLESIHDGIRIAKVERDVEVSQGWFEWGETSNRYTDSVKLGIEGSGLYTIKLSLYDKQGNWIMDDLTTRTI